VPKDRKADIQGDNRKPVNDKRTIRVLVIEDDLDLASAVCELLNASGHEASNAVDGMAALQKLRDGHLPDVILLDLMMPRMDGWKFREQQMSDAQLKDIPVVVLSAGGQIAESIDVTCILRKPVDPAALLNAIKRVSRERRRS
jgi:two-component system, chemotaxis family, chemotaxis protein CheY